MDKLNCACVGSYSNTNLNRVTLTFDERLSLLFGVFGLRMLIEAYH